MNIFQVIKTITFCVIRLTCKEWGNKGRHQTWVHLSVPIHFYEHRCIIGKSGTVAGDDSPAYAEIGFVIENSNTSVKAMQLDVLPRGIGTAVIHYVNSPHFMADAVDNAQNMVLDLVAGNDYRNTDCSIATNALFSTR